MQQGRRALARSFVCALLLLGACETTTGLKLLQVEDVDGASINATELASVSAEEVPSEEVHIGVDAPSQETVAVTDATSEDSMQREQLVLDPASSPDTSEAPGEPNGDDGTTSSEDVNTATILEPAPAGSPEDMELSPEGTSEDPNPHVSILEAAQEEADPANAFEHEDDAHNDSAGNDDDAHDDSATSEDEAHDDSAASEDDVHDDSAASEENSHDDSAASKDPTTDSGVSTDVSADSAASTDAATVDSGAGEDASVSAASSEDSAADSAVASEDALEQAGSESASLDSAEDAPKELDGEGSSLPDQPAEHEIEAGRMTTAEFEKKQQEAELERSVDDNKAVANMEPAAGNAIPVKNEPALEVSTELGVVSQPESAEEATPAAEHEHPPEVAVKTEPALPSAQEDEAAEADDSWAEDQFKSEFKRQTATPRARKHPFTVLQGFLSKTPAPAPALPFLRAPPSTMFVTFFLGKVSGAAVNSTFLSIKAICGNNTVDKIVVITGRSNITEDLSRQLAEKAIPGCMVEVQAPTQDLDMQHPKRGQLIEEQKLLQRVGASMNPPNVVFYDPEMLFIGSTALMWKRQFDIGFPVRTDNMKNLIMMQVKYVRSQAIKAAQGLWAEAIRLYEKDCPLCHEQAMLQALSRFGVNFEPESGQMMREMRHKRWVVIRWHMHTSKHHVTHTLARLFGTGNSIYGEIFDAKVALIPCNHISAVPGGRHMGSCYPLPYTQSLYFTKGMGDSKRKFANMVESDGMLKTIEEAGRIARPPKAPKPKPKPKHKSKRLFFRRKRKHG